MKKCVICGVKNLLHRPSYRKEWTCITCDEMVTYLPFKRGMGIPAYEALDKRQQETILKLHQMEQDFKHSLQSP
jgi:transcription initiation factor TFIIIB Brf1 subunit/transcription initiation factor TFIIB